MLCGAFLCSSSLGPFLSAVPSPELEIEGKLQGQFDRKTIEQSKGGTVASLIDDVVFAAAAAANFLRFFVVVVVGRREAECQ